MIIGMTTAENDIIENLAVTLFDIGAIRFGKFKRHNGKTSHIYLDLRVLVSYPQALRQVTAVYRSILDNIQFDVLAATPLAGLPLGTALSLDMDKPLIYPRKTAKSYGTGKGIEGAWSVGHTAVVIDDLIASGNSVLQTIVSLKVAGLQVQDAVVLLDREQTGVVNLAEQGYKLHAISPISRILSILEAKELATPKQVNKALKSLRKNL